MGSYRAGRGGKEKKAPQAGGTSRPFWGEERKRRGKGEEGGGGQAPPGISLPGEMRLLDTLPGRRVPPFPGHAGSRRLPEEGRPLGG